VPGKRVQFDQETWNALDLLARDRMRDFQELADEAFADLLHKHDGPVDLKTALRQSVGEKMLPQFEAKCWGRRWTRLVRARSASTRYRLDPSPKPTFLQRGVLPAQSSVWCPQSGPELPCSIAVCGHDASPSELLFLAGSLRHRWRVRVGRTHRNSRISLQ